SGLVALYGGLFVLIIYYIGTTRRFWKAAGVCLLLAAMPLLAYFAFPSFKAKMGYVQEDLSMQEKDSMQNYSDAGRLASIEMGLEIAKENLIVGVGAGDLRLEVKELYKKLYPKAREIKLPHNQFVWVLAANGIVGFILFSIAFFYPLLYKGNYRHPLFLAFNVIIFSSFLTESTLETALGVALYLFFLLLSLNYIMQYCPQTNVRSEYERLPREPNLVR
ncbi:MAG: O-antigen ligase family protein, partial [Saprospiraceae bacterium]